MFEHDLFDNYSFEEVPLNQDIYLMDEKYISEYEQSLLKFFDENEDVGPVGYISYAAARSTGKGSIELSWYPNIYDRYHEVVISLPKEKFIACVGSWQCSEKPHIFVNSKWYENLHLSTNSVFGLIDAIGVKNAIEENTLTKAKILELRSQIDLLSSKYKDVIFMSFADSILMKSNWTVGSHDSDIDYTYRPEIFVSLVREIRNIYKKTLGLDAYGILTQGINQYYQDGLVHMSESKNHICLNSLGVPFAQVLEIEGQARKAIKAGKHSPSDLYLDHCFFNSLRFKFGFEKKPAMSNEYQTSLMNTPSKYWFYQSEEILKNLSSD